MMTTDDISHSTEFLSSVDCSETTPTSDPHELPNSSTCNNFRSSEPTHSNTGNQDYSPDLHNYKHEKVNRRDNTLTHVDRYGNACMVNVGSKSITHRRAVATGKITLTPEAFKLVCEHQLSKKGSVLGVSQLAGIMAAKQTSNLIPLCHNIPLTNAAVNFDLCESSNSVMVCASVECVGVTGVEMEAICAVSVALMTVYDMTKAVSKDHVISEIRLEGKEGGASGHYARQD